MTTPHPALPCFNAVILDMDGLVLDSETTYRAAWGRAARSLGFDMPREMLDSFSGRPFESVQSDLLHNFGDSFPLKTFRARSSEYWRADMQAQGIEPKPGIREFLGTLKRYQIPYCLATNSRSENANQCLRFAGLNEAFPLRVCRDQVRNPKPAPDIFIEAARVLNSAAQRCIVFEDSVPGITAATRAGAIAVQIPDSSCNHPLTHPQAFAVLGSLFDANSLIISTLQDKPLHYP